MTGTGIKKRLFIGLLLLSLFIVIGLVVLIWFLAVNREVFFYRILLGSLGFLLGLVVMVGLEFWHGANPLSVQGIPPWRASPALLPTYYFQFLGIGHLFGLDKNQIKGSFIEVNNQMVHTHG